MNSFAAPVVVLGTLTIGRAHTKLKFSATLISSFSVQFRVENFTDLSQQVFLLSSLCFRRPVSEDLGKLNILYLSLFSFPMKTPITFIRTH